MPNYKKKMRSAAENRDYNGNEKQGTCMSCGQKTHKVVRGFLRGSKKVPLDSDSVLKGRCLICKPLKPNNQAEEAISRLSMFESRYVWQSLSGRSLVYTVEDEKSNNASIKMREKCFNTPTHYEERDDNQSSHFSSTWTIAAEFDIKSIANDDRTVQTSFGRTCDAHVSAYFDDEQSLNGSVAISFRHQNAHDMIAVMDSLPGTDCNTKFSSSSENAVDRYSIFLGSMEKYIDTEGAYCVNTTSYENDAFVDTIKKHKGPTTANSSEITREIEVDELDSSSWGFVDQDLTLLGEETTLRLHLIGKVCHRLLKETDESVAEKKSLDFLTSVQHDETFKSEPTLSSVSVKSEVAAISKSCAQLRTLFNDPKTATVTASMKEENDIRRLSFSKEMVNSSPSRAAARERVRQIIRGSNNFYNDNSSSLFCKENDVMSCVSNSSLRNEESLITSSEVPPNLTCDSKCQIQQTTDIEEVKVIMSEFIDNAAIQEIGCKRFRDLSWTASSPTHCGCDSQYAEIIESIVVAMITHASSSNVQKEGCSALWALSTNDIFAVTITTNSGVTTILAAMVDHIYHVNIQVSALKALSNLARLHRGVDSISKHQGVTIILQSMRACDSVDVYEWACKLLHLLTAQPKNLETITSEGGLEAIFVAMLKWKHDIRIIEDALSVVSKIASIGFDLEAFTWVEMIVNISKIHSSISCIQKLSCMILSDLAKVSFDNQKVIASCGGIDVAKNAILHYRDPRVHEEACACLRSLSCSKSVSILRHIAQSDVIDALTKAIDEHPTNNRIQNEANSAIPFICGHVDYKVEIIPSL